MYLTVPPFLRKIPINPSSSSRCFKISNWITFTYNPITSQTAIFVPGPGMRESIWVPVKKYLDPHPPTSEFKSYWFFKTRLFWGPHISGAGPKVWCAQCGAHTSNSLGRASVLLRSLAIVYYHAKGGIFGKTLFSASFTPFDCGPFILCCGKSFSANFQFSFSSGNYSICSCGFGVYMGGSGVKDLPHYHLMMNF